MRNRGIVMGTIIGLLLSCVSPNGVGLAESPDPLEAALFSVQEQWQENARVHAGHQRLLTQQALMLSASGSIAASENIVADKRQDNGTFFQEQQRLHDQGQKMRNDLCMIGREEYCNRVDLNKLAHAVAVAETQDCTTGVGLSKNNCHGIFQCAPTGCTPMTFASREESYKAFKQLWMHSYGNHFPTIADAQRYVNSDATEWYGIVTQVYYN
jgi:hypothetical protein